MIEDAEGDELPVAPTSAGGDMEELSEDEHEGALGQDDGELLPECLAVEEPLHSEVAVLPGAHLPEVVLGWGVGAGRIGALWPTLGVGAEAGGGCGAGKRARNSRTVGWSSRWTAG